MKWVTREYVHVDRTACPWLVRKFIDSDAEFIFAPTDKIGDIVKTQNAIPFDAPNVKLGHRDGKCSFETIIEEYKLKDAVLHELAKIIHAANTKDAQAAPEGAGLSAVMVGLRAICKDDFEAMKKAELVYDALYAYSKMGLIREKYSNELASMTSRQQQEFVRKKLSTCLKNRR